MNGLDLFSGIGGITKALDGYVRPVAYCEIEPYARAVLLSRMATGDIPTAPIWDDVTTLRGAILPRIDIIYGGFPCQDISVAGKQVGLGGKRSGLFFEIMRLARETNTEWIFLENVPNIRTKGLGRVLKELESVGYDCRWGVLSASDVGANHKRERWFLLAHSEHEGRHDRSDFKSGRDNNDDGGIATQGSNEKLGRLLSDTSTPCPDLADANCKPSTQENTSLSAVGEGGNARSNDSGLNGGDRYPRNDWWLSEPNVGRVADGVPHRVDRLRALGNAVVPAQVKEAFERLMGLK